jgi:hypothetical protein
MVIHGEKKKTKKKEVQEEEIMPEAMREAMPAMPEAIQFEEECYDDEFMQELEKLSKESELSLLNQHFG